MLQLQEEEETNTMGKISSQVETHLDERREKCPAESEVQGGGNLGDTELVGSKNPAPGFTQPV